MSTSSPKIIKIEDKPRLQLSSRNAKGILANVLLLSLGTAILFLWYKRTHPDESNLQDQPAHIEQQNSELSSKPEVDISPNNREKPSLEVTEAELDWSFIDPQESGDSPALTDQEQNDILTAAKQDIDQQHYYTPDDNNALQKLNKLLRANPENEQAQSLKKIIAEQLFLQASQLASHGQAKALTGLIPALNASGLSKKQHDILSHQLNQARKIELLLNQAKQDIADGRFIKPDNDSALFYLLQILSLEPSNQQALKMMKQLENDIPKKAIALANKGSYDRAKQLVKDALKIPGHGIEIEVTLSAIVSIQINRRDRLLAQAVEQMGKQNFNSAISLIKTAEEMGIEDGKALKTRQLLANARLYGLHEVGEIFADEFLAGQSSSPKMVVIPAGRFIMGAKPNDPNEKRREKPAHRVIFERGFAISQTEVSVAEFRLFIEDTKYVSDAEHSGSRSITYSERNGRMTPKRGVNWRKSFDGSLAKDNEPVLHVSWNDAVAYADWLSTQTGESYRLPTEAEFEYVAIADTSTLFWWGNGTPSQPVENLAGEKDKSIKKREWKKFFENYSDGYWGPAPTGSFISNPFNVYDILGNVSEWTQDCWHDSYARSPSDGSAWINKGCAKRVVRGGSWASAPVASRPSNRIAAKQLTTSARLGFRVARDL
ncbi:MAG: SUMF1/EgtB/PvdO family nonheme iron enzyme [bacterium]